MHRSPPESKVRIWLALLHDEICGGSKTPFVIGTHRDAVEHEVKRATAAFPLPVGSAVTLYSTLIDLTACKLHGVWMEKGGQR